MTAYTTSPGTLPSATPTTTSSVEVPRSEWASTLDAFSRVHDGWLVSLDLSDSRSNRQREFENLPLVGVSADLDDHEAMVVISVTRDRGEYLAHPIPAVSRIAVERSADGAEAALQIDSADGTKSVLRFRTAVLPECVDGVGHL